MLGMMYQGYECDICVSPSKPKGNLSKSWGPWLEANFRVAAELIKSAPGWELVSSLVLAYHTIKSLYSLRQ